MERSNFVHTLFETRVTHIAISRPKKTHDDDDDDDDDDGVADDGDSALVRKFSGSVLSAICLNY